MGGHTKRPFGVCKVHLNGENLQSVSNGFLHLRLSLLAAPRSSRVPRMVEGLKSRATTGSKGAGVRKKRSGRAGQRTQDAEVLRGETNGFQGAEAKVKGGEIGGRRSCRVGEGER